MKKDESGQSIVETAIIIPILLLLLVGILDFGRVIYFYAHLHMAAQETVRIGSFGKSDAAITTFAKDYVHLGESSLLQVEITPVETSRRSGDYLTVTLRYPLKLFTPLLSNVFSNPVIKTDSTIRVE